MPCVNRRIMLGALGEREKMVKTALAEPGRLSACGGWIGRDHTDSKSVQPGATPGLSAILIFRFLIFRYKARDRMPKPVAGRNATYSEEWPWKKTRHRP